MFTAVITIGGAFPVFNLLEVLKGNLPAGITISRTYPGLENSAARIILTNAHATNVIYEGRDSNTSATNYGVRLQAGQVETIQSGSGWNDLRINRWIQSTDGAGAPAAGTLVVTVEQK